jgi:UDP-N-acetylglucosamine:LPS N-acetylglucosamine transferase
MGAVSELAAAGKPSILVPLPGASDEHQPRMRRHSSGRAARLVLDEK